MRPVPNALAVSPERRCRTAGVGVVVFGAAALLLLSWGGAIVVAPLTVPLMFLRRVAIRRAPSASPVLFSSA